MVTPLDFNNRLKSQNNIQSKQYHIVAVVFLRFQFHQTPVLPPPPLSAPTISLPQMNGKYSFPIQSFTNVNCVTCQGPYHCASEQSVNFYSLFVNKHVCLFKTIETMSKTNKIQRKRLDRKRGEESQPFMLFQL